MTEFREVTQIEQRLGVEGSLEYWYRGWRLEQKRCEEPECHCGRLCWYTYSPYETTEDSFEAIGQRAGMSHLRGQFLQRSIDGSDPFVYNTIEQCIDAFEEALEEMRREALQP